MHKGKQAAMVAFLLCLILAIAMMPLFFLEYQNKKMLNRIETTALQIDGDEQEIPTGDILDRILMIRDSVARGNEMLIDWQEGVVSEEKQQEIIGHVHKGLSTLQGLKALPPFNFGEVKQYGIIKRTFMDMEKPNNPVNVWSINVEYSDYIVFVYMDAETYAFYELSIQAKSGSFTYDLQNIWEDGFAEYLKYFCESLYKGDERFSTNWYYHENEIGFYITSYNDKANTMTSYSFQNDVDYATVTGIWEIVDVASQ